jgi:hypothetical protein
MALFIVHLLVLMVFDEFAGIPEFLIIIIRISHLIKLGGVSGAPLLVFMLKWGSH